MKNFEVINKALMDCELSDKAFRMFYLITNTMNINKTNQLEVFNGFLMDKLNLSERQVQRLMKEIVEKGYLVLVKSGSRKTKNGNVYKICTNNCDKVCDKSCDNNCDKNVTLNKREIKEDKIIIKSKENNIENNIINTIEGKILELKDISKYIKIFEKNRNKENYDKAVEMIEMASRQKRINTFNLKNQLLALNQMIPTDMKEIIIAKPIENVLLDNENTSSYGIITLKANEYSIEDFEEENDSMFEEEEEDVFVRLYA